MLALVSRTFFEKKKKPRSPHKATAMIRVTLSNSGISQIAGWDIGPKKGLFINCFPRRG